MRVALFLACTLLNSFCPAPKTFHVAGDWRGAIDVRTSDGAANRVAIYTHFMERDKAVTGTFGPAPSQQYPIESGLVDGDRFTFQVAAPTRVARFAFTVIGEGRLEGNVRTEDGKAYGKVTLTRD